MSLSERIDQVRSTIETKRSEDALVEAGLLFAKNPVHEGAAELVEKLLEGAPEWLNVKMMQDRIVEGVPGVSEIHHVHIWGLTPQQLMLTMHMSLSCEVSKQSSVLRDVKAFLKEEYGIGHVTIEVDVDGCADH